MKKLLPKLLSIVLTLSAILLASQTIEASWNLDTTPPVPAIIIKCNDIPVSSPYQCASGTTATISTSCTDLSSGCKTTTYTVDGTTPASSYNSGTHSVSVTSVDNAGNTAAISVSFTFLVAACPAAFVCPTVGCHDASTGNADGSCGTKSCLAVNLPAEGTCPTCLTAATRVPDGRTCSGTKSCPRNCLSGNYCTFAGNCVPLDAWIQTTGGDVHSNTNINLPGGP